MADIPRLRPRQWALLERLAAIDKRLESDPIAEPIAVSIFDQGTMIVLPRVADAQIDETDLYALDEVGALDLVSRTPSLVRFRVSQHGFDLLDERAPQGSLRSAEEVLGHYRQRRRWLASRISVVARWVILLAGAALVVWSAITGSWPFIVIGIVGAIFGLPVTTVADRVHGWLTSRIDRFLEGVFEPRS